MTAPRAAHHASHVDVAIIGAGPAGIAAAVRAAECGARVAMLDEGLAPGGQIWRRHVSAPDERGAVARSWLARLERSAAQLLDATSVFDITQSERGFSILAQRERSPVVVSAERIILATGARERFLPFPGWTLPNVFGVGGGQALLKAGVSFRGKRMVIAGSGPLLLPVAASMTHAGARVLVVAEQASTAAVAGFAASLWSRPSTLLKAAAYRAAFLGTPYLTGTWVTRADGERSVTGVTLVNALGRTRSVACDVLCTGYGLVPSTELARLVGCATRDGVVVVDAHQRTSVEHVYSAGEPNGIAGVECAIVEGEIAGLCAAGGEREADALMTRRESVRSAARALDRAFALRAELCRLPSPETIVCRCEDVPCGALSPDWTPRQAKLYTRAGMGACQGRVCGAALQHLFGWQGEPDRVRSPVTPVLISTLLTSTEPAPTPEVN